MACKRCKHGMIEAQCGVCKRWEDNCWEKKEETEKDNYRMGSRNKS